MFWKLDVANVDSYEHYLLYDSVEVSKILIELGIAIDGGKEFSGNKNKRRMIKSPRSFVITGYLKCLITMIE